ncbi:MAG: gliding motility-associated ABC transporter substrate-binding protein GldG [Chitinophagaceae bacterium]|nr:gliding motility-associated ABC transporter substrate-binding protein GldG [Chitinophagaceae bacterium]
MQKILYSKYGWLYVLAGLVIINLLAAQWHSRIDLTAEKRYTISQATRNLLHSVKEPVTVTVFLEGDMPAGFKKLAGNTRDMLQEFKEIGGNHIQYYFRKPGEGMNDSSKMVLIDSLQRMGIHPTNVKAQVKRGEGEEQRLVYPGAVIEYQDRVVGVNLLKGLDMTGGLESLNNAEALLEYKLAGSIDKVMRDTVPVIGYLTGNGQPQNLAVYDLIQGTIKQEYGFGWLPIDSVPVIPDVFDALLVVKPQAGFSDAQKLKLDQYVMNGGKMVWLIDNLYASLDSLRRTQGNFIAFDMGLNIDDLLFKYGVRINPDLVQDLTCSQVPMAVGSFGDRPQLQLIDWTYFPLLTSPNNNPIAKNLDYVLAQFPQSLDTVQSPGVQKTILLATSGNSRITSTPAKVELNSAQTEDDIRTFNREKIPVAVLLEGQFSSLFANRISLALKDSLANIHKKPFRASTEGSNKMIVVSDADIVTNEVSQSQGPLEMGENPFTHYRYANKEFFLNCLEYLVGNPDILKTRGKDYTLRLLDKKKTEENRSFWQMIAIAGPVALVILFAVIYIAVMRKRYQ